MNAFEEDRQAQLIVSINEPTQVNLFENSFYLLVNHKMEQQQVFHCFVLLPIQWY